MAGFGYSGTGLAGPPGPAGSVLPIIVGTSSAPVVTTAVGGVTVGGNDYEVQYVVSDGGAIVISANPQIQAGTLDGERLTLIGTSDTNTIELNNGTGIRTNGACVLKNNSVITFVWDDTAGVWDEESRNDI